LLEFPDLENTKVIKKISEEISIDYYFLNSEKVIDFLKIKEKEEREAEEREAKEREALGLSKSTHLRQKKLQKLIENF
jgi:hypothetical protein